MNEKSSAPITGATSWSTRSLPTTSRNVGRERGLPFVVAGDRIVALVGQLGGSAVELRGPLHHLVQALLQQVAHLGGEAARGAARAPSAG